MRNSEQLSIFSAFLAISFALPLLAAPAHAQPAQRTIEDCYSLREASRLQEAVECFRALYRQEQSLPALVNLGTAEAASGLYVEAEEHLALALANRESPWIEERREVIEGMLREVRRHLGTLILEGGPENAPVFLDSHLIGTLPIAPIRVVIGDHRIEVRYGEEPFRWSGEVEPDETARVQIPAPASEPPSRPIDDGPSPLLASGIATVAVGGAAVIAGVVIGGLALAEQGGVQEACPDMMCRDQAALDQANNMVTLANAADGLLIGGGVIAAAGVVLAVLGASSSEEGAPQASLQCSGQGCLGSVRWSF